MGWVAENPASAQARRDVSVERLGNELVEAGELGEALQVATRPAEEGRWTRRDRGIAGAYPQGGGGAVRAAKWRCRGAGIAGGQSTRRRPGPGGRGRRLSRGECGGRPGGWRDSSWQRAAHRLRRMGHPRGRGVLPPWWWRAHAGRVRVERENCRQAGIDISDGRMGLFVLIATTSSSFWPARNDAGNWQEMAMNVAVER